MVRFRYFSFTGVSVTSLVSTGQRITDDNGSTPEDRIATVFDVIE